MRRRKLHFACLLAALFFLRTPCCSLAPAAAAEAEKKDEAKDAAKTLAHELVDAHKLYLGGNYAEAQEKYEAAVAKHPLTASLGLARCLASEGKLDEAKHALEAGLAKAGKDEDSPAVAKLHAESARLAFDAGDYDAAAKRVNQALAVDEKNRQAPGLMRNCIARPAGSTRPKPATSISSKTTTPRTSLPIRTTCDSSASARHSMPAGVA